MEECDELVRLIAVGLDSNLAKKIISKRYDLTKQVQHLINNCVRILNLGKSSISKVKKRKPIPSPIINRLVSEADWKCCICWKICEEEPVVIHHIKEYSKTGDNTYENLVLLCPNHHALAHSDWKISRHPLSAELLRERKKEWAKAVIEFKKGLRPAPGKEPLQQSTFNQSDKDVLTFFRLIIDRLAMHQPFRIEGNMYDLLKAITDIIRALNTGILKTREGDVIYRTKPRSMLLNPNWMEKLEIITSRFEDIHSRFEMAVRDGEMILRPDGFYAFHNQELPNEIDSM